MILTVIIFIIGIALLVKGADLFVGGGSGLALRHSISPALIGFTIIAFGTSLPELVVSTNAAATGNTAIALGNVLGSNIANIALILALCTFIRPDMIAASGTSRPALVRHTVMMLVATAAFALLATLGTLGALSGVVLLVLLWSSSPSSGGSAARRVVSISSPTGGPTPSTSVSGSSPSSSGPAWSSRAPSQSLKGSGSAFVIGLSVVAVGTSLPELATSLVAALRDEGAIYIGNILGSNIFNLLLVLGVSLLLAPVTIGSWADIIAVVLFTVAILPLLFARPSVVRGWSVLMLVGYAAYIAWAFAAAPVG